MVSISMESSSRDSASMVSVNRMSSSEVGVSRVSSSTCTDAKTKINISFCDSEVAYLKTD